MLKKAYSISLQKAFKTIDWKLLILLVMFLNVQLVVKMAALVLIYLLQFNFKFGFRFQHSRLPLFYPAAIGIGLFNGFVVFGFSNINYSFALITGIGFWLVSILAIHQVKLSIEQNEPVVIHKTIQLFFILNAAVSLSVYIIIVFKTGAVNPYLYQGEFQKYFIGTGDYIKGISFDTSTTNAVLNAFGIIYFLTRKNALMVMLCTVILLLTASNITNLLLWFVLLWVFIFQSDKVQKSLVLICVLMGVIFMTKISPQNNKYMVSVYENIFNKTPLNDEATINHLPIRESPDSTLTTEERKQKLATLYLDSLYRLQNKKQKMPGKAKIWEVISIPTPNIHTPPFQRKSIISPYEENMLRFVNTHHGDLPMSSDSNYQSIYPGKIIAWWQTLDYLQQHPSKIIMGSGMGNFSSKLAFRTTGMKIAGGYPQKLKYMNADFVSNHLDLYLYYFTKADGLHSLINSPNSVYNQLLSEYGLLGLLAFFIFYLGFFIRQIKKLTYGIPLLFLLSGIFFVDYWFEQLSIVVFFELLIFLNIKEEARS